MAYRILDDDDINFITTNRASGHKVALASALEHLEESGFRLVTTIPGTGVSKSKLWIFHQA